MRGTPEGVGGGQLRDARGIQPPGPVALAVSLLISVLASACGGGAAEGELDGVRQDLQAARLEVQALEARIEEIQAGVADGGRASSDQVRGIDEIMVVEPTVVEITHNSATLEMVTNVNTVCAVAYGATLDYGLISADDLMAPNGHKEHHHLLLGLEPDTSYHYKWGLVGPDGTVYGSSDFTFRTSPAPEGATQRPDGDNLALLSEGARVVGTSSNFGGAENDGPWGANSALDGDPTTAWSSDGDGDDAWIEVQLPAQTNVTAIGFWTRTMGATAQVFSFRVVTDDGEKHGPFSLDGAASTHYFSVAFTAKGLRFELMETSGGNTGAVEVEVYGERAG